MQLTEHRSTNRGSRPSAALGPARRLRVRERITRRDAAPYNALRATSLAAAGDTADLAALADSVESLGRGSAYGRDPRLHHHVRGLLFPAREGLQNAVTECRASSFSPAGNYTRTNNKLAKMLIRLDRPRDAAYLAEAALRGGLDAAASYATLTEVAEVSAIAWDAAAVKDKAIHRHQQVLDHRTGAEPAFGIPIERARIHLAMLMTAR